MSFPTKDRLLGFNILVELTTGSGSISLALLKDYNLDEAPTKKGTNVSASTQEEKMFTKNDAKLSLKGARGLSNCYSDLPAAKQRITGINFSYVDEDGNAIAGDDLPTDLTTTYAKWAVITKKASGGEDEQMWDLELESGVLNAIA